MARVKVKQVVQLNLSVLGDVEIERESDRDNITINVVKYGEPYESLELSMSDLDELIEGLQAIRRTYS